MGKLPVGRASSPPAGPPGPLSPLYTISSRPASNRTRLLVASAVAGIIPATACENPTCTSARGFCRLRRHSRKLAQFVRLPGRSSGSILKGRKVWEYRLSRKEDGQPCSGSNPSQSSFAAGPTASSFAPGEYWTAINVHNPIANAEMFEFRRRFVIAPPGEKPGKPTEFVNFEPPARFRYGD